MGRWDMKVLYFFFKMYYLILEHFY